MKNLHKLFYNDYYKHKILLDGKSEKESISYDFLTCSTDDEKRRIQVNNNKILNHRNGVNRLLLKANVGYYKEVSNAACNKNHSFSLNTLYPGLITGVGIDHEAGVEGEFKLGVHFDYTYGMPVIYGSSVKGVLSSYFKDYAKTCLPNLSLEEIVDCYGDIFHGRRRMRERELGYVNKSIYDRDIFFDAVVEENNKKGRILDSDNLCPHGSDPLKNPIPISFLKIAAGVKIQFRFKLVDTAIDGNILLDADTKKQLFEKILMEMGIGAKTNVGYGQFEAKKNNRFIDN